MRYARSRMDRRAREDHSKVEQAAHRVDERCFENPSLKAFSRSYLVGVTVCGGGRGDTGL